MREILVSLASFNERRASVTSELQHNDVDSLFTFWDIFIMNSLPRHEKLTLERTDAFCSVLETGDMLCEY